ncbi:MAG: type II toxin-antitoxin system RelE/ParE family toxin [Desulfamplus sp.]|nr:type II toxin-antitoxin system RelE/ParE family toxin [Desulfamplus sp.]
MKITIKKAFLKDLQNVSEPQKSQVKLFLESLNDDVSILDGSLYDIKKLQGETKGNFFRLRFGNYRLGYEKKDDEIVISRILHRRDIYRSFP